MGKHPPNLRSLSTSSTFSPHFSRPGKGTWRFLLSYAAASFILQTKFQFSMKREKLQVFCRFLSQRLSNCALLMYNSNMMWGSKGILTPDNHGLLRTLCSRNPKNIRNPPCSGYFLMFCGSQSHAFTCKHETHDLLTLVS